MSRKINYGGAWSPPSSEEVSSVVSSLGGQSAVARILKKNRNTVHYWCTGQRKIDYANWKVIREVNIER